MPKKTAPALIVLCLAALASGCAHKDKEKVRETVDKVEESIKGALLKVDVEKQPSRRLGYTVSGPFNLDGTIIKDSETDTTWMLDATLTFPTGGYAVGEPRVMSTRSMPEQVNITIPVTSPPAGAMVTQALVTVPIQTEITGMNGAQFRVFVEVDGGAAKE